MNSGPFDFYKQKLYQSNAPTRLSYGPCVISSVFRVLMLYAMGRIKHAVYANSIRNETAIL